MKRLLHASKFNKQSSCPLRAHSWQGRERNNQNSKKCICYRCCDMLDPHATHSRHPVLPQWGSVRGRQGGADPRGES